MVSGRLPAEVAFDEASEALIASGVATGGMLAKLRLPFLLGAGGRIGSGRQWLSWIALADAVGIVRRCLTDAAIAAYNTAHPAK